MQFIVFHCYLLHLMKLSIWNKTSIILFFFFLLVQHSLHEITLSNNMFMLQFLSKSWNIHDLGTNICTVEMSKRSQISNKKFTFYICSLLTACFNAVFSSGEHLTDNDNETMVKLRIYSYKWTVICTGGREMILYSSSIGPQAAEWKSHPDMKGYLY